MNFLNQAYTQTLDLFRSMTPGARITAGLLLAVVVCSLAYLFRVQTAGTEEYLFGGREFSQSELANMEAAFAKGGYGNGEIVGNRMRVPRGLKDKYLAALADNNALPANFNDSTDRAMLSSNPFDSTRSFDAKMKNAKQKELSLIISKMKGIRAATVQFDEIEKGFPRRKERSALIAVQAEGNTPLEDERVRAIRGLVVAAIAGLDPANVAVSDLGASVTHPGVGPNGESGGDNLYAEHKRIFERDMQKKILDRLAMYPGLVVGVNVELNTELEHRTQGIKYDAKAIPLAQTDFSKESTSTAPVPGGRPGAVPNGVGSNAPAQVSSTPGPQSQTTESRNDQKSITGHEQTIISKYGLTPKRMTASIAMPTSYFTKVWREMNPTPVGSAPKEPAAAELRKIEDDTKTTIESSVVSLFPAVERGTDRYPLVTVTTYTDLPRAAEIPIGMVEEATDWLAGNWQTLALIIVGLGSLLMLRGMLRPGPTATPSAAAVGTPAPQLADSREDEFEGEHDDSPPSRKRRFRSGGTTLRDELTDMVKEDPDAAANVLKSWIGDAA